MRKGEDRDFLAAGAACGICVAFQAPLAGCLFIVEEAASFYTTEHLDYTFFATMIAYLVALALATSTDDGFTKFKQTTGYFCTIFDQLDMLMFVAIASVGGLLGALFNLLVKHLNTLRVRHVNKSSFRRVAEEVTLLALLTGTVTVFLPSLYRCEHPTRSLLMEDSIGCLSEEDAFQISHGSVSHAAFAELVGNTTLAQQRASAGLAAYRVSDDLQGDAWTDVVWIDNSGDDSQHRSPSLPAFVHVQRDGLQRHVDAVAERRRERSQGAHAARLPAHDQLRSPPRVLRGLLHPRGVHIRR